MSNAYITPSDVPVADRPRDQATWEAICALYAAGRLRLIWWDTRHDRRTGNPYAAEMVGTDLLILSLAHIAYDEESGLYDRRTGIR
jgi:hypothetical protein